LPGPSSVRVSLAMLVAANLLPLFGVLFSGWSVFIVMSLFWLENVIIGAWNVPRMATQLLRGQWGALFLIPFFIVHYGLFCAIHGLFVMGIFGHDQPIPGGKIEASPLAAFTLMGRLIEADPACCTSPSSPAQARSPCSARRSGVSWFWFSSRPWWMHGRISPNAIGSRARLSRPAPLRPEARCLISSRA